MKRRILLGTVGALAAFSLLPLASRAAKPAPASPCLECHEEIARLRQGSPHAKLDCTKCHRKTAEHLADSDVRPVTETAAAVCAECHKEQYAGLTAPSHDAPARREKSTALGRSPMQDKLLGSHGFNVEHNEPRGHAYMVIDQFIVDRFVGGRFQLKSPWAMDAVGKTWDVLVDTGQELPLTAKAGNPTCLQCKTSDHVLQWKFLGEKDPRAKWDRTSDVVAVAKDTRNPMGCIHCHDPHAARPRVIRDGLIAALERDAAGNPFAREGKTDVTVVDFRGFRKIGLLGKSDSRLLCAQCHVEYNCNAGTQWSDGQKVAFTDPRTNHFPLKGPKDLLEHYRKLDFYDFKHEVTGARLIKLQHPEAETYAGSVHDQHGVTCVDCHMPKVKKGKKTFTDHQALRPKLAVKRACQGCHPKASEEQLAYVMDGTTSYVKGKMRKAEYWLGKLIDTYAVAKRAGVDESVLAEARAKHEEAHVLWEWWTAENSDGWHNPKLARETLTASAAASKAGIAALTEAMAPKK